MWWNFGKRLLLRYGFDVSVFALSDLLKEDFAIKSREEVPMREQDTSQETMGDDTSVDHERRRLMGLCAAAVGAA